MNKIIQFPTEQTFESKLIRAFKKEGYTEEQIQESLQFIKDNSNNDEPEPPPSNRQVPTLAKVIQLPIRMPHRYKAAA